MSVTQIRRLYHHLVHNVTISSSSSSFDDPHGAFTLRYSDVCPRRGGQCVVDGQRLLVTADRRSRDPLSCVRPSDRGALTAAAAAGVSFESATRSPAVAVDLDHGQCSAVFYSDLVTFCRIFLRES